MPTRWGRVYSIDMTKFTREEVEETVHKLKKANLSGIDLSGANLSGADLTGAVLWDAGLYDTTPRYADLYVAKELKYHGAYLSNTNLTGATYNKDTQFPDDFDPEAI